MRLAPGCRITTTPICNTIMRSAKPSIWRLLTQLHPTGTLISSSHAATARPTIPFVVSLSLWINIVEEAVVRHREFLKLGYMFTVSPPPKNLKLSFYICVLLSSSNFFRGIISSISFIALTSNTIFVRVLFFWITARWRKQREHSARMHCKRAYPPK